MTLQQKAAQLVGRAQVITLASIDEQGFPRPVPLVKLQVDAQGAIYVSTGTSSTKTAHFKANPKAGVSVIEEGNCVVYTGMVEVVNDPAIKRSLWSDWMAPHFANGGINDPEYCVLKFAPRAATYYIDNEFVKQTW